jgi:peptide-methionine (S)-S-oxide reductase
MNFFRRPEINFLAPEKCIPGSATPSDKLPKPGTKHFVTGNPLHGPFPKGMKIAMFGMGCFWCSEALFWKLKGVFSTQVRCQLNLQI